MGYQEGTGAEVGGHAAVLPEVGDAYPEEVF